MLRKTLAVTGLDDDGKGTITEKITGLLARMMSQNKESDCDIYDRATPTVTNSDGTIEYHPYDRASQGDGSVNISQGPVYDRAT